MHKFKILGINHIGIACKDTPQGKTFLESILNLGFLGDELVTDQKTHTFLFNSGHTSSTEARIELLQDASSQGEGPIAKFLAKKGSGVHHLALSVDDIDAALDYLKAHKVKLLDLTPRKGAHNTRIAFIHPEATGGFLLELVQEAE